MTKFLNILTITLFLLFNYGGKALAQTWDVNEEPIASMIKKGLIDPDTLDEKDIQRIREQNPLPRNNVAKVVMGMANYQRKYGKEIRRPDFEKKNKINIDSLNASFPMAQQNGSSTWQELKAMADEINTKTPWKVNSMDYLLNDRYEPIHETFLSSFWKHIYVGGGLGMEKLTPQGTGHIVKPFTQLALFAGKELDKKHGIRLSLGGGWGYMDHTEKQLMRISSRLDYLFNLSTHFDGYKPSRSVEMFLMLGAGVHLTGMRTYGKKIAPEGHLGMQFRFFTGPKSYFNLEPYAGMGNDQLDLSGTRNWKGYDMFWGVQGNYVFYLQEHLSPESKNLLLRMRMANDRVIDKDVIDSWRTPWFVEAASGVAMTKTEFLGMGASMGSSIRLSVGRWLSPLIGAKLSFTSRNTKWKEYTVEASQNLSEYKFNYTTQYLSTRAEVMFNPLAINKKFTWNDPFGVYILAGGEYGTLRRWDMKKQNIRTHSEAYHAALHGWYKLSEDMHVFIEPRFTHNIFSVPYTNVDMRKRVTENTFGVDLGLTMMIRSNKFSMLEEFDDVQEYTYRFIRGVRIGLGAGFVNLQRQEVDYGGGKFNWSGQAFAEYRFNFLHSVRASIDMLNLSRQNMIPFKETVPTGDGKNVTSSKNGLFDIDSRMMLMALNYEVSLTNLCSGPLKGRRFELEAFAGPAAAYRMSQNITIGEQTTVRSDESIITPTPKMANKFNIGIDAGLKLSSHIWNGIYAYFTPTVYLISQKTTELNVYSFLGFPRAKLYQTFNFGVQYKCGKVRINPETIRRLKAQHMAKWRKAQIEEREKREKKLKQQQENRRKKYNEWRKKQQEKLAKKKSYYWEKIEVDADD